jgi:hypothetical protein
MKKFSDIFAENITAYTKRRQQITVADHYASNNQAHEGKVAMISTTNFQRQADPQPCET